MRSLHELPPLRRLLRAAVWTAMLGPLPAGASQPNAAGQSGGATVDPSTQKRSAEALDQKDILVIAQPQERGLIDRTLYVVKDNAEAQTSSALDLLGRVPLVDVSPSGAVLLMGRGGVAIQIDGREVPNAGAFLGAMTGAQVAKIELVTNPSAQFSARGTGGIINIVTRRRSGAKPAGSIMAKGGSLGSNELRTSPTWRAGKLSLGGNAGFKHEEVKYETQEVRMIFGAGEGANQLDQEESRGGSDQLNAAVQVAVEIAPKQTVTVDGMAFSTEGQRLGHADIVEDEARSEERSAVANNSRMMRVGASYRREGSEGEQASISVTHTGLRLRSRSEFAISAQGGPSFVRLRNELSSKTTMFKADHIRSIDERRLSIGAQFEHHVEENGQRTLAVVPRDDPTARGDAFKGAWSEAAAYATYQFPLAGNRVLAGARVEARGHDLAELSSESRWKTHFFPSLHVERTLGQRLTANLSYSSRIGWPGLALLDPRLRFSDPSTARAGNPLLRPEKTHSLELKLMATLGPHAADLSATLQRTRDLRSELAVLEGDVLVSRPVNVGMRTSLGTSVNLRGPLARGLRYTVTGYLARQRMGDAGLPGVDERAASYGASVQLDYRDGVEGRAGADQVRLAGRFAGPSATGLTSLSSTIAADASWSHALTGRLAAVLTASHVLKSPRITTRGPDLVSRTTIRASGPSVHLALTFALGSGGQ